MPRIRLRIEEETPATPCRYRDPLAPGAGALTVPVLRLVALARIEPAPGLNGSVCVETALIDTGAWVSVIETAEWEKYERLGLLERLPLEPGGGLAASVGGRASGYLLGRIWVSLHDFRIGAPPRSLPAVPVVAQLLTNPLCVLPYPLIFGLHRGVLDGRKLTREVVPPRPSALQSDRGPHFAQEWFLETP